MPVTVTIRLIELEPSAGSYDGTKVELSSGAAGYVEVNQTYTEVTVADGISLSKDVEDRFIKRMIQYVLGIPNPTAYIKGKDQ